LRLGKIEQVYTIAMPAAFPRYPWITKTSLGIVSGILMGGSRDFRADSCSMIGRLKPPLGVTGTYPSEVGQGLLIAVNHYHRPGFPVWWLAFSVSGSLPWNIHWITSSAWTYPDRLRSLLITPVSRWAIRRLGRMYGFTNMPPMPPRAWETGERAVSVRAVMRYVHGNEVPVVGLSPEGGDSVGGVLMPPPSGVGRFVGLMAKEGLQLLPIGVFEEGGALCLSIGAARPLPDPDARAEVRDALISEFVMRAIAALLPERLRGPYG
jgi:hypothetical protein